MNIGFARME